MDEGMGERRTEEMIVSADLAQVPLTRVHTSTAVLSISRAWLYVFAVLS